MRSNRSSSILSTAASLVFLCHVGVSGAQSIFATGDDADVTEDGLHRVHPSIMEAAWVRPDFDLSNYTRILLMPTGNSSVIDLVRASVPRSVTSRN